MTLAERKEKGRLLNEYEVSAMTGVSLRCLRRYRLAAQHKGARGAQPGRTKGPKFIRTTTNKAGVRYRLGDVEKWMAKRSTGNSSSRAIVSTAESMQQSV